MARGGHAGHGTHEAEVEVLTPAVDGAVRAAVGHVDAVVGQVEGDGAELFVGGIVGLAHAATHTALHEARRLHEGGQEGVAPELPAAQPGVAKEFAAAQTAQGHGQGDALVGVATPQNAPLEAHECRGAEDHAVDAVQGLLAKGRAVVPQIVDDGGLVFWRGVRHGALLVHRV